MFCRRPVAKSFSISNNHIHSFEETDEDRISLTDFPVSRVSDRRLCANVSGLTSRNTCELTSRRRIRPNQSKISRASVHTECAPTEFAAVDSSEFRNIVAVHALYEDRCITYLWIDSRQIYLRSRLTKNLGYVGHDGGLYSCRFDMLKSRYLSIRRDSNGKLLAGNNDSHHWQSDIQRARGVILRQ